MNEDKGTPLSGPPPKQIPLPRAPLVRVLAQVRFPQLLVIQEGENLSSFQEHVRDSYPFLTKGDGQNVRIELSPHGPKVHSEPSVIWQFVDESGNWRLSLAPDAVTVETKKYISRADFLERLEIVLKVVEDVFAPKIATRVGIRYVDQLKDGAFDVATQLIKPSVVGMFGLVDRDRIVHGISEIALKADEGNLLVKWGQLPPKTTFDPNILEPIESPSWVLDIDMSSEIRQPFAAKSLKSNLESFSERVYSMFRWVIEDEFISYYGGRK